MQQQRLFFALWPSTHLQQQWAEMARTLLFATEGRLVPSSNLHLTLAFLGNVSAEQRDCAEAVASDLRMCRFSLLMEQVGYWHRSHVVWLGARRTPVRLRSLAQQLSAGLVRCGFEVEKRDYKAHMTLMRKVFHGPERAVFDPIEWDVDRFVLVESQLTPRGAHYRIVGEWFLV